MRLCIFGSRNIDSESAFNILIEETKKLNPESIVTSGDARGVCKLAIMVSKKLSLPCKLHYLNQAKYARGKYDHRSREVLSESDFVLFLHDGFTTGTKNEIKLAEKMNIPYKYINYVQQDFSFDSKFQLDMFED